MIGIGENDNIRFSTRRGTFNGLVLSCDTGCVRPLRIQFSSSLGKHIERFNEQDFLNVERICVMR